MSTPIRGPSAKGAFSAGPHLDPSLNLVPTLHPRVITRAGCLSKSGQIMQQRPGSDNNINDLSLQVDRRNRFGDDTALGVVADEWQMWGTLDRYRI